MYKIITLILLFCVGLYLAVFLQNTEKKTKETGRVLSDVSNFSECVAEGNPVMESYPRQCRSQSGQLFIEYVGNGNELSDLIRLNNPRPNETISSPLTITGEARGNWFFEATFPVVLTNWDGLIIAEGYATAEEEWMTTEFVPFSANLTFSLPEDIYSNQGTLILKKDNPSGLPEHDASLEIPVILEN